MAPPKKTVVLDVVGLTRGLISAEHTPFLERYLSQTDVLSREIEPAFPALTCPAQSTYLTGAGPAAHGVTANVSTSDDRAAGLRTETVGVGLYCSRHMAG